MFINIIYYLFLQFRINIDKKSKYNGTHKKKISYKLWNTIFRMSWKIEIDKECK